MKERVSCIALRTIKYADNRSIVTCLSRQHGPLSFVVNDGATVAARRRRALMMPGCSFECVVDMRPGRELHTITDVYPRRLPPLPHPAAQAVALFICDFTAAISREAPPDALMFDYVDQNLDAVFAPGGVNANSAITFVVGLGRLMGIAPDLSTYHPGALFDMRDGIFRTTPPMHSDWLAPAESSAIASIMRITLRNQHVFKMSREQRAALLDGIIRYYSIHFGAVRSLRSLDVLHALFD